MIQFIRKNLDAFYRGPLWTLPPVFLHTLQGDTTVKPEKRKKKFFKTLCFWTSAWIQRSMSMPLKTLFLLLIISIYAMLYMPRGLIASAVNFLIGLFLIDFAGGFLFRPKLEIIRSIPERIRSGASFSIHYHIVNKRRFSALSITMDPVVRQALYFLKSETPQQVFNLPGKQEMELENTFHAIQRGIYTVPQCLAVSSFPFNLWQFSCTQGTQARLIVHPVYFELENIRTNFGTKIQKHSLFSAGKTGDSSDFFGCRDFHYGDPLNKISWKATAKYQKVIVKEFQAEHVSRAAVILDNRRRLDFKHTSSLITFIRTLFRRINADIHASDPVFEAVVSLGASITHTLERQDFRINLFAAGSEIHRFPAGRGQTDELEILDLLASVKQSRENIFDILESELMQDLSSIGCVFLILLKADNDARLFQQTLAQEGAAVQAILIADEIPEKVPDWIQLTVTPEMVFSGNVRMP